MKIGDLVRDEFGNVGVVVDMEEFTNGPVVQILWRPNSGYGTPLPWVLVSILEVISESR